MAISRFAVKSATVTFGTATYDVAGAPAMKGETKEAVDVTALSDQVKKFISGALREVDDVTLTIYQKGSNDLTVSTAPAALSIAVVLENGVTEPEVQVAYGNAIITKVSPPNQDASGDRKATYDVTFRPDGTEGTT